MATTAIQRLRRDIGLALDDTTSLSDADAQALLDEAAETYTEASQSGPYARVLAIQGILASAAKLTSYRQNSSSEQASDVFKHLMQLLEYWQGLTDGAVADGIGAVRSGRTRQKPRRVREFPGW